MTLPEPTPSPTTQDDRYEAAAREHGAALVRLARSYEDDPERRKDLLQEIHFALWRSLESFDGRCSTRTWTYRVAHNVATTHVLRDRRRRARTLVSLEALEALPAEDDAVERAHERLDDDARRNALLALLHQLAPLDRQLMLLYLEGLEASAIAEITGLSAANVATKIHRIKKVLATRVRTRESHAS